MRRKPQSETKARGQLAKNGRGSIIQALNRLAPGPGSQGHERVMLGTLARDAVDEMDRAIREEQVGAANMIAGKIVQTAVSIIENIDPVVVSQNQGFGRTRGGMAVLKVRASVHIRSGARQRSRSP